MSSQSEAEVSIQGPEPARPAAAVETRRDATETGSRRALLPARRGPAPSPQPAVLIPRPETPVPAGHRRCPSLPGDVQPMVRQTIDLATCTNRQCDGYHKCVGCVFQVEPQFAGRELPPPENSPSRAALARLAK